MLVIIEVEYRRYEYYIDSLNKFELHMKVIDNSNGLRKKLKMVKVDTWRITDRDEVRYKFIKFGGYL